MELEEKNKELVLKGFDTLFNKRDYLAAEKLWSPEYIQHSAHIPPGRAGLFDLINSLPSTLKYESGINRSRRGLRNRSRAIFGARASVELDRGRHSSH